MSTTSLLAYLYGQELISLLATDLQGNPRQHAHISFAKAADAAAAFKHSGTERFVMMERTLNVDMAPWIKVPTEDVRRQMHFRGLEGDERTLRKALSKRLNTSVEFMRCECMVIFDVQAPMPNILCQYLPPINPELGTVLSSSCLQNRLNRLCSACPHARRRKNW